MGSPMAEDSTDYEHIDEVQLTCAECHRDFWCPRWQWEEDIEFDDYEPYCGCADVEPPGS